MDLLRITRRIATTNAARGLTLLNQIQPVGGQEAAALLDEQLFWSAATGDWPTALSFVERLRSKAAADPSARAYVCRHAARLQTNGHLVRTRLKNLPTVSNPASTLPLRIGLFGSARALRPLATYLWPTADIDDEPVSYVDLILAGSTGAVQARISQPFSRIVELRLPQDRCSKSDDTDDRSASSASLRLTVGGRILDGTVDIEGYAATFWSRPNGRKSLDMLLGSVGSGTVIGRRRGCQYVGTGKEPVIVGLLRDALKPTDDTDDDQKRSINDVICSRIVVVDQPDAESIVDGLLTNAVVVVVCRTESDVRLVGKHFSVSVIPFLSTSDPSVVVGQAIAADQSLASIRKRADAADNLPARPSDWLREAARFRTCHLADNGRCLIEPFMPLLAEAAKSVSIDDGPDGFVLLAPSDDVGPIGGIAKRLPLILPASTTVDKQLKTTFVTGLYELRSREPQAGQASNGSCKSAEQYISLAAPLLEWTVDLIVFTDPTNVGKITNERRKRGLLSRTVVVPIPIEQNVCFRRAEPIHKLFGRGRAPARFSPTKDTPLYVWNQAWKWTVMRQSITFDPFKSTTFYWIDFGIHHVAVPPPSLPVLWNQLASANRLRCTFLRHDLTMATTADRTSFFASLQQAVGGGLVGGPKQLVSWLCTEFGTVFDEALTKYERPVLDEAVLGVLATQNLPHFLPIFSGHREMLLPRSASSIVQDAFKLVESKQNQKAVALLDELPIDCTDGERSMAASMRTAAGRLP